MSSIGNIGGGFTIPHYGAPVSPSPAPEGGQETAAVAVSVKSPLLAGSEELQRGAQGATIRLGARGEGVKQLQVALKRLGLLSGKPDGVFGRGTERSVALFQRQQSLGTDAIVGQQTLAALDNALQAAGPEAAAAASGAEAAGGPQLQDMAAAAQNLVNKRGQNYGVDDPWYNVDSRHALPANVRLGGLKGSWKCNLFAGNTMAAAGFEPPYYNNRGHGEYPNANQLYKWSDKYAGQFGNKGHERFALQGEVDVQSLPMAERQAKITELLKNVQPGDMIIVDHPGSDVADGGHCRVVTSSSFNQDGTVQCAQASFDSALIRDETLGSFTGEEHIWILRPNTPRKEGAARV